MATVIKTIATSEDPFIKASEFTSNTSEFVQQQIDQINDMADEAWLESKSAIDALEGIAGDIAALPTYSVLPPALSPYFSGTFDIPGIDIQLFGSIDDFDVENEIDTNLESEISDPQIPDFDPTPLQITIPPVPDPIVVQEPGDPPPEPLLQFPADITIDFPMDPDLLPIQIPYPAPTIDIPPFDPVYPEFMERQINTLIDWQEPTYIEEVIDEVKVQLTTFFAGGSGIDPDVEDSIFARGRDREDRTVLQQEMQATEEWATRGYTAPPGMLVKRIDNIREEGMLKKLGLNREATIKIHQDELDNLRFACQQGIAAEELYIRLFLAKVERLFEIQKLSVLWEIELYNLTLQVFIAQMEEVKIRAQVYEVQVQALMLEIEIYKALIDVEKTKVDMNVALIQAYTAQVEAREAKVRIYSEQVKAVGIKADVYNTQVQAYKGEVEAYGTRVEAEKVRFDAYTSQIRGEAAKADILSSEARAYQSEVSGIETGVRAEVAALEGEVSALEVEIRNYEATVRGQVGRAQAQLGQIEANVAGNRVNTERFVAETGAEEAASRVEVAAWEGANRFSMDKFKADVVGFQANLERAVKAIELAISSQGSAGQLASTVTAGALAAAHVGATINGSGQVGASGSNSYTGSVQESISCSSSNQATVSYQAENFGESGTVCPSFAVDNSSSGGF